MFDIAWSELLLIAIVALIFIGPKELPQVLHNLGKAMAKLRRSADEFRRQFEDSMKEAGYEDLHKNLQDFRHLNPANQLKNSIDRALNQDYTAPSLPAPATPEITAASDTPAQQVLAAAEHTAPGSTQSEAVSVAEASKPNGAGTVAGSAAAEGQGDEKNADSSSAGVQGQHEALKERATPLA
jgi:sec-independent protein translocase protein TatB